MKYLVPAATAAFIVLSAIPASALDFSGMRPGSPGRPGGPGGAGISHAAPAPVLGLGLPAFAIAGGFVALRRKLKK